MSIGLYLLAKFNSSVQDPDRLLQQMSAWVHQRYSDLQPQTRQGFVETYPTLFCRLHPAAEELELSLIDLDHLRASANTSTVGPGYHIFACSLLQAWARDFDAAWLSPEETSDDYWDEAEYFFTGDQQQVFDNMTAWLRTLTEGFFDGTLEPREPGDSATALCMSMDVQFESDQLAITPLGPRDSAWLLETSRDGAKGKDFFAWWTPGLNAEYFLGRALAQMWSQVRWRPPVNDPERNLLQDVANSLHIANKLDPSLSYPWVEWAEVLEFLGTDNEEKDWVISQRKGQPTIGYRRHNVTVMLPDNWSLRLPGSFSDFNSDEDNALCALDPPREIWFTAYRFTATPSAQSFESKRRGILQSQPELLHEDENYIAEATIQEKLRKSGECYFVLNSSNVAPSKRSVCTILFENPEDREWAIGVWRSLKPGSSPAE